MKKLSVLLIAFILFGFNTNGEPEIALKVTQLTSLGADKCAVDLELHNKTNRKIHFLSMYCSDSGFYVTDNPDVVITPKPCDKNFPTSVPILRNSYRTARLELQILKKTKQTKFRIGFKFIEIPKDRVVQNFDTSSVESVTIWSNAIEYKGR